MPDLHLGNAVGGDDCDTTRIPCLQSARRDIRARTTARGHFHTATATAHSDRAGAGLAAGRSAEVGNSGDKQVGADRPGQEDDHEPPVGRHPVVELLGEGARAVRYQDKAKQRELD